MLVAMRRLAWIALAICIGGVVPAASAGGAAISPLSLGTFRTITGSVAALDGAQGQIVRFSPHARFAVGVTLHNNSGDTLIVTRARLITPPKALIHQTFGQFYPVRPPVQCSPDVFSCPQVSPFDLGSGVLHHQYPIWVAAGREMGVEFDLREGSCADVPTARDTPITRFRVTFHKRGGPVRNTVVSLIDELRLRMPKPADCTFPRSELFVNGRGPTATNYIYTIPGSRGDVCMRAGHTLTFLSRAMGGGLNAPERIEIRVANFAGEGNYRGATATAKIVSDAQTAYASPAILTVTKATPHEVFGRVRAGLIHGWMRCRVRG